MKESNYDNRTEEAKALIAAGKLDPNDCRYVTCVDYLENPQSDTKDFLCSQGVDRF